MTTTTNARSRSSLLNAYRAPLSALTSPRSHYFLEFPTTASSAGDDNTFDGPLSPATDGPRCMTE